MLLITLTPLLFPMNFKNQCLLETNQPPFSITKPNTFQHGAFAWITKSHLVLNSIVKDKAVCWDHYEFIKEKVSWSLILREIEINYDDRDNTLIYHGQTLTCLHGDGFRIPTILTPLTYVWFPEDLCLIFSIHSLDGYGRIYGRINLIFSLKLLTYTLNI